jgi:NADPH:quinone reductase-like Zn-dependent oxidoreductase
MRAGTEAYFQAPLPFQLGREASGVVAGVGPGVEGWHEGDAALARNINPCGQCTACLRDLPEVCLKPWYTGVSSFGASADYVVLPAKCLVPKPPGLSHHVAAAFQGGTLTAWHDLITRGQLHAGETILIVGGSGAVGSGGIAVARHAGARVIATAGGACKAELARSLGAHVVIDHRSEDLNARVAELTQGQGVDVLFDTVGGEGFAERMWNVGLRGRVVVPGGAAGERVPLRLSPLIRRETTIIFAKGSRPNEMRHVLSLLADGQLEVAISHVFPLEQSAEAHRTIERREHFGRVVLDVAGEGYLPTVRSSVPPPTADLRPPTPKETHGQTGPTDRRHA